MEQMLADGRTRDQIWAHLKLMSEKGMAYSSMKAVKTTIDSGILRIGQ